MALRVARLAGLTASMGLVAACTFEPGLSNAPSINRQRQPTSPHDVISNGPEGCDTGGDGGSPFPNRAPPCNPQNPGQPAAAR